MKFFLQTLMLVSLTSAAHAQGVASTAADTITVKGIATQQPLRPGDIVRLRIWREPDLTGDYAVDETGVVVFPMLGPIHVVSLTSAALRDTLVKSYKVYLQNPSVLVILLR